MQRFEKIFTQNEFLNKLPDQSPITIVYNQSSEKRNYDQDFMDAVCSKYSCTKYILTYQSDNDTVTYGNEEEAKPLCLGINELVKKITNAPILINITTMNLQVLGFLLKVLKNSSITEVYCMYTEPKSYAIIKDKTKDVGGHFDLHRKMKSIGKMTGYVSMNVDQKPSKWVPFLGFDGFRAQQVSETYEFRDCIPVVTLPSYRPLWQNFIIQQNISLLDAVESNSIQYVAADSFLSAYEELEQLTSIYPKFMLRVSPFGTKINAMGILLYALDHEGEIDIVYDNPIAGDATVSEEVGETLIFDISEFMLPISAS